MHFFLIISYFLKKEFISYYTLFAITNCFIQLCRNDILLGTFGIILFFLANSSQLIKKWRCFYVDFQKEFEWHFKLAVFVLSVAKNYMCLTQFEIKKIKEILMFFIFSHLLWVEHIFLNKTVFVNDIKFCLAFFSTASTQWTLIWGSAPWTDWCINRRQMV